MTLKEQRIGSWISLMLLDLGLVLRAVPRRPVLRR